jgi:hypothetical protein
VRVVVPAEVSVAEVRVSVVKRDEFEMKKYYLRLGFLME